MRIYPGTPQHAVLTALLAGGLMCARDVHAASGLKSACEERLFIVRYLQPMHAAGYLERKERKHLWFLSDEGRMVATELGMFGDKEHARSVLFTDHEVLAMSTPCRPRQPPTSFSPARPMATSSGTATIRATSRRWSGRRLRLPTAGSSCAPSRG